MVGCDGKRGPRGFFESFFGFRSRRLPEFLAHENRQLNNDSSGLNLYCPLRNFYLSRTSSLNRQDSVLYDLRTNDT